MTDYCSSIIAQPLQSIPLYEPPLEENGECSDQYISAEIADWIEAAKQYGAQTISFEGLKRGANIMAQSTTQIIDTAIPVDNWLLAHGMGTDRENILVGKIALYGGAVLIAAIFLPGWFLVGVMVLGLASSMIQYGEGYYQYLEAQTPLEKMRAIEAGQEAGAKFVVGSTLLALGQGVPALVHSQWIPIHANVAVSLQTLSRAVCLTDDPYFVQQAAVQAVHLSTLPKLPVDENHVDSPPR